MSREKISLPKYQCFSGLRTIETGFQKMGNTHFESMCTAYNTLFDWHHSKNKSMAEQIRWNLLTIDIPDQIQGHQVWCICIKAEKNSSKSRFC